MAEALTPAPPCAEQLAVHEAARWFACLMAEDATPRDHLDWQAWLDASATHRQAWERLQTVRCAFGRVPGNVAAAVLSQPTRRQAQRRSLLSLAGMGLLAGSVYGTVRDRDPDAWHTATGQQRKLQLDDGSQLYLNTATRVTLDFNDARRRVVLRAGEILVQAHPDDAARATRRPFIVSTPHGDILPQEACFTVRLHDRSTRVEVLQQTATIRPGRAAAPPAAYPPAVLLQASQAVSFDGSGAGPIGVAVADAAAWLHGQLAVVDRPLAEVIAELARYRPGILRCDPAVADLKVSGVFSLRDTDEALAAISDSFPVQVRRHTRYWVTVMARPAA